MKRYLFALCFLFLSVIIQAQDTSKITAYTGLVGIGSVNTDDGTLSKWANFRVGVRMKKPLIKNLSFDGWLGYDPTDDFILFRASFKQLWKDGGISAGFQPTPVSEIRPYPLSVDGQFEFTAEGMPPGGALGTSLWYKRFKIGLYLRNRTAEYLASYTAKIFAIGMWTTSDKFGGVTAKMELPLVYLMATYARDDREALALAVQPLEKLPYKLAWDFAVRDGAICNNLVALQHPFTTKKFADARCGITYDFINRSFGAFFLIGINHKE